MDETEVKVIQYLRPDGKKQVVFANVGLHHAQLAKNMIISAELLTSWFVAIYVRFRNEPEGAEIVGIATNEDGENNPTIVLQRLIEKVAERHSILDTRCS